MEFIILTKNETRERICLEGANPNEFLLIDDRVFAGSNEMQMLFVSFVNPHMVQNTNYA